MCNGTVDAISDSARLRGLKQILGQRAIDRSIGDQIKTRHCKRINNHQLVWLIVGMGLFAGKSYRNIFRRFVTSEDHLPSRTTLGTARKRLSANLLEMLYGSVGTLLAKTPDKHPFAFYKGLRLMGVDGTLLDCPDSESNRQEFGRPSNQNSHGAFPKVRVVSLCELGTRVLWKNVIGTYHQSEQKLTLSLLDHLDRKMLLMGDRHYGNAPIVFPLLRKRIPFLIRFKNDRILPVEKVLSDGSFLSTIYPHKNDRRGKRPGKRVRVIRYTHHDPTRAECGKVHILVTNLLDETKDPAAELIELYHVRWEEELAFSEWKVSMGKNRRLRSETPEMVRQEIWGTLLSHWIVRSLIFRAAEESNVAPARISFTGALDILHARLPEIPKSRKKVKKWFHELIAEIAREQLPPRANRINPRKIKKRGKAWPTKRDSDRRPPKPNGAFMDNVEISI